MARRERGYPTSSNRASSFHLWWETPERADALDVTLEVIRAPSVVRLYFWAVQASFVGGSGRRLGGAHLGLQWHPSHPRNRAVNWGGYGEGGEVLDGTESGLPSATGNRNTRDLAWEPGRPYRLRIERGSAPGWWRGVVTDLGTGEAVVVRELPAGGSGLASPVVWSEVFARCDDPPVVVRWSDPVVESGGVRAAVLRYRVTYQSHRAGGCTNTDVVPEQTGVLQITNRRRVTPDGAIVAVAAGRKL